MIPGSPTLFLRKINRLFRFVNILLCLFESSAFFGHNELIILMATFETKANTIIPNSPPILV